MTDKNSYAPVEGTRHKETDTTAIMLQSLKNETKDMREQKTKAQVKKTKTIR